MSEMDTSFFNLYYEFQQTTDIWDIRDFNHAPCSLLRKTTAPIHGVGLWFRETRTRLYNYPDNIKLRSRFATPAYPLSDNIKGCHVSLLPLVLQLCQISMWTTRTKRLDGLGLLLPSKGSHFATSSTAFYDRISSIVVSVNVLQIFSSIGLYSSNSCFTNSISKTRRKSFLSSPSCPSFRFPTRAIFIR